MSKLAGFGIAEASIGCGWCAQVRRRRQMYRELDVDPDAPG
jgi:hypothetical protein